MFKKAMIALNQYENNKKNIFTQNREKLRELSFEGDLSEFEKHLKENKTFLLKDKKDQQVIIQQLKEVLTKINHEATALLIKNLEIANTKSSTHYFNDFLEDAHYLINISKSNVFAKSLDLKNEEIVNIQESIYQEIMKKEDRPVFFNPHELQENVKLFEEAQELIKKGNLEEIKTILNKLEVKMLDLHQYRLSEMFKQLGSYANEKTLKMLLNNVNKVYKFLGEHYFHKTENNHYDFSPKEKTKCKCGFFAKWNGKLNNSSFIQKIKEIAFVNELSNEVLGEKSHLCAIKNTFTIFGAILFGTIILCNLPFNVLTVFLTLLYAYLIILIFAPLDDRFVKNERKPLTEEDKENLINLEEIKSLNIQKEEFNTYYELLKVIYQKSKAK